MRIETKLGQNFLVDKEVLENIIRISKLKKGEKVLEIGPGKGILTEALLKAGVKVMAVEIDRNLVEFLKQKFQRSENLRLVNKDILQMSNQELPVGHYKIIANLPYQITSPIIRKFLQNDAIQPRIMVIMIQKEVAERICAVPGDSMRGFLSVLVQYYGRPEIIKIVPREAFYPKPKVESAILKINLKSKISNLKIKEANLFRIIQAGFSQKRKKLRNSLAGSLHQKPRRIDILLKKAGVNPNLRAEDLENSDWIRLLKSLEKYLD